MYDHKSLVRAPGRVCFSPFLVDTVFHLHSLINVALTSFSSFFFFLQNAIYVVMLGNIKKADQKSVLYKMQLKVEYYFDEKKKQ